MTRNRVDHGRAETDRTDRARRPSPAAALSCALTLGAVLLSLVGVPAGLTYALVVTGPPTWDGPVTLAVGMSALVPGFLMGATALWVSAHD